LDSGESSSNESFATHREKKIMSVMRKVEEGKIANAKRPCALSKAERGAPTS
jgi:hypothetical protein